MQQGKAKVVYLDDESIFLGSFKNGAKHGVGVLTCKSLRSEITYNMGVKEGPYFISDPQNQYEQKGTHVNGVKHG